MFGTGRSSGTTFDDLLVTLAAWLLLGCAVWVIAIGVAALVEVSSRGRVRATTWVGCPRPVRRLLLGGLGVALAASPTPVIAASSSPEPAGSPTGLGLPVPARAVSRVEPQPVRRIEVHDGDCLWDLARSQLPPGASAGRIDALVDATYRRNRRVIGHDPDLLRPGQRLVLPDSVRQPPPEETP